MNTLLHDIKEKERERKAFAERIAKSIRRRKRPNLLQRLARALKGR